MAARHSLFALALLAAQPALASKVGTLAQTNLTSDGAVSANVIDPNLKNPWGMSYSATGAFWISDNATGLTTVYNGSGAIVPLVVTIPPAAGGTVGDPTGQVFNSTKSFVISQNGKSGAAAFIFVTEDGTISGWNNSVNGTSAVVMVDRSAQGAVYKGVALYVDSKGNPFLYAADFHNGNVDVFDGNFALVTSFHDNKVGKNYSPYNVALLGGNLYVAYAKVDAARHDSLPGKGFGAIDEIDSTGKVLKRYAHGHLNGPWGMAIAPSTFGPFAGDILVGNFGDGTIDAFSTSLEPKGVLKGANKKPLSIDGLWGLIPGNGGSGGDKGTLYFTAGPNEEADGLFGSLTYVP
jgi:uncharacterized protein (TIGR03118 family)